MIYKIFRRDEWARLQQEGRTAGGPVDLADGYIHFSAHGQVAETAAKHFAGEEGLVLLAVDEATLGPDLRWEPSRGGALFPHLYRDLALDEVISVHRLELAGGRHVMPEGVQ